MTDEESPARVEMLDRLGPPFTSAFRPQEALSPQVLAAMVPQRQRRPPAGRVRDRRPDRQRPAERDGDQATAILRGGRVDPNSGQPGYDGVQAESNPDPLIYRPAVDPPRYPRLLAAGRAAVPLARPARALVSPARKPRPAGAGQRPRHPAPRNAVAIGSRKLRHARPRDARGGARKDGSIRRLVDAAAGARPAGPVDPRSGRSRAGASCRRPRRWPRCGAPAATADTDR